MLVINRYENRQTGKVTIQAHVIKGKKLIKSYAPCCYSLIDMIAQNYSFYLLCDVDYYSKLNTVKIVNVKWIFKGEMKMNIKQFKHVGKVYCLNIGDSFYTKCGSILKVENKTFDYIFTLSNGKNYTPNQVYSLIK